MLAMIYSDYPRIISPINGSTGCVELLKEINFNVESSTRFHVVRAMAIAYPSPFGSPLSLVPADLLTKAIHLNRRPIAVIIDD